MDFCDLTIRSKIIQPMKEVNKHNFSPNIKLIILDLFHFNFEMIKNAFLCNIIETKRVRCHSFSSIDHRKTIVRKQLFPKTSSIVNLLAMSRPLISIPLPRTRGNVAE